MTQLQRPPNFVFATLMVLTAPVLGLTSCSDETDSGDEEVSASEHPLVILTERVANDLAIHYLHVVEDWPKSGKLDYSKAVELGAPGVMKMDGSAIYFYHAEDGEIERFTVDERLKVKGGKTLSFVAHGIKGFDPEPIWVSEDLAFMVDEKTAKVARFNPSTMKIETVEPVNPDILERDGLKVQFQLGVAAGDRLFTAVNWRSWDTNTVYTATVLGVF